MATLSYEAIARTLSIPERIRLNSSPKVSEVDILMPTFQKLNIFKHQILPLDEALSPLCKLEQLKVLSHEDYASLSRRASAENMPKWLLQFNRWTKTTSDYLSSNQHGSLNLIDNLISAAFYDLEISLKDIWQKQENNIANFLLETLPTNLLTQIIFPSVLLVYRRDYSNDVIEEYFNHIGQSPLRDAIYEEFPLIVRLVVEVLTDWIDACVELTQQLIQDKELLLKEFHFDIRNISGIKANLGDRHVGGASVTVLEAGTHKIVYKPRNASGEQMFAKICEHLPELEEFLPYIPKIIERDNYHWQEFIDAKNFAQDQTSKVAKKLGVLNAILYFLMADDMHHENIQISGENIAILDAECLLNVIRPIDFMSVDIENISAKVLANAAYTIGIVPQPINSKIEGTPPLDISVIGYKPGGIVALNVPQITLTPDGQLSLVNSPAKFNEEDSIECRPLLLNHGSDFIEGFQLASYTLINHRQQLLELIESLPEPVVRVLPRPTMIYSKILSESFHPTFMRDAGLRDACLCKLLPRFYGKSYRSKLISAELNALRNARIPYTELNLKHNIFLIDSHRITTEYQSFKRLHEHIFSIDEKEINRQSNYIDMSFASSILRSSLSHHPQTKDFTLDRNHRPEISTQKRLENLINEGVTDIVNFLIRNQGEIGYAIMNALAPDCWSMGPAGMDLYNGLAGLHLMFERIRNVPFVKQYEDIYHDIEQTVLRFGDAISLDSLSIKKNIKELNVGLFDQLAGIAISQYLCLQHPEHYNHALVSLRKTCSMLLEMLPYDKNFDIISGASGTIFLAHMLFSKQDLSTADRKVRDALIKSSIDRLLSTVQHTDMGSFWPTEDNASGLTGLSHGATGIAASLALGSKLTGYKFNESLELINAALTWEQTHFDFDNGWADLRDESHANSQSELQAWCHGAGGAYISRYIIKETLGEHLNQDIAEQLNLEIAYSLEKLTEKTEFMLLSGASDCLCHGTIGNLLILQRAVKRKEYDKKKFDKLLSDTITRAECENWRLGGLPGLPSNSFMMGMPGIIWGLLALHSPQPDCIDPIFLGM